MNKPSAISGLSHKAYSVRNSDHTKFIYRVTPVQTIMLRQALACQ
jgi:hypothetical protein